MDHTNHSMTLSSRPERRRRGVERPAVRKQRHNMGAPHLASEMWDREPYNNQVATLSNPVTDAIAAKVHAGQRITPADARRLWQHATDAELRDLASDRPRPLPPRRPRHLHGDAHHQLHQRLRRPVRLLRLLQAPRPGRRLRPLRSEAVFAKLDELLALGGDLAAFNGGFNPHLPLDYYCDLFSAIRAPLRRHDWSSTRSPSPSSSTSPITPS